LFRIVLVTLSLALAGCAGVYRTDYVPLQATVSRDWRVTRVDVSVPEALRVSDENRLVPDADIVWHGDPPGDRKAQVSALVREAIRQGASGLHGRRAVAIQATVLQFHAVTPITLATAPSAVDSLRLAVQVSDARTGEVLLAPVRIDADMPV